MLRIDNMKKYLLPLILIICLAFAISGYSADLFSTYDQRIKLTVDKDDIDTADLTWFPVTVFFTSTQGEEIFSEFDADSDYMKCAFTKADGTTQLYAEMELFDVSESKAIYHVSLDGWVIDYDADTDFYYYYDNDASDNTTYIGAINTTAGGNVWDGNYEAVYHMVDATTSTVLDSTSNNNDGTKKGAGEPASATGKIGLAQDFDGSNDHIGLGNVSNSASWTIEGIVNLDVADGNYAWLNRRVDYRAYINTIPTPKLRVRHDNDVYETYSMNNAITVENDYHLAWAFDDTNCYAYINGVANGTFLGSIKTIYSDMGIGTANNYASFNGILDEIRISSIARTAGWIKATYNSLWDTLLTYGSEETEAVSGANVLFIFSDF